MTPPRTWRRAPLPPSPPPYQTAAVPDPTALTAAAGSGLTVTATGDAAVVHDARLPAHWARITDGPEGGRYAHNAVYRDELTLEWLDYPTEAPYPYGTTSFDEWPARTPNDEPLTLGKVYWLRPEESHPDGPGWLADVGGGSSDWDTYKVVSGEECEYTLDRQVPDPAGECGWLSAGEEPVTAYRLPSVEIGVVPDIDPGQFVLARPKAGVPGEYEMSPWGSVQKAWDCGEYSDSPASYPQVCVPDVQYILIGSCKFYVVVESVIKYGFRVSARDLRFDIKEKNAGDCDDPFDPDSACSGLPHSPPPPPGP